MLVLCRKVNESIILDGDIRIVVLGLRGKQVRLGIEAPERVDIIREELILELCHGGEVAIPDAGISETAAPGGLPPIRIARRRRCSDRFEGATASLVADMSPGGLTTTASETSTS